MEDDAHDEWRGFQQYRNLFISQAFVITQHEHLAGGFSEFRDGLPNEGLQFAIGIQALEAFEVHNDLAPDLQRLISLDL